MQLIPPFVGTYNVNNSQHDNCCCEFLAHKQYEWVEIRTHASVSCGQGKPMHLGTM